MIQKERVRPKKYLGQHFLKDEAIAKNIVESLSASSCDVLEIGPGTGVLTKYLLDRETVRNYWAVEIDLESVNYLSETFPTLNSHLLHGDFLKMSLSDYFPASFAIIGNFPYNISASILFKVFELHDSVSEVVGMFQKEVAERISAKHGSKTYGILSVLLSAFYEIEYLFTVPEHVFDPPPAVKSAVVRLKRNARSSLPCDQVLFVKIVKAGFNQRRKTLRNALKSLAGTFPKECEDLLNKRAEQLSVENFVSLTQNIKFE